MLSWGIISGATSLVRTPLEFYIARFFLGVAEAGFFPGVILYLTYWFPKNKIRNIISIFIMSIPTANMISSLTSGFILGAFHNSVFIKDWQWLLLLQAIPSIVLSAIFYKFLPDKIEDAAWLSDEEKNYLFCVRSNDRDRSNKNLHTFPNILKNLRVWLMIMIGSCFSVGMYGVIFWLPTMIKSAGIFDAQKISLLSSIPWAVSMVCLFWASKIPSLNIPKKYFVVVPGMVCFFAMVISVSLGNNIYFSLFFLSIAVAGIMCVFPGFWGFASFLEGKSAVIGFAAINTMSNIAGFLSPYLIGKMIDLSGNGFEAVLFMAGFSLLGSVVAYFSKFEA
jgi:MFS family permease